MVRMELADAAVDEIMATTFRVRVKRLILVKGPGHQGELEEISHRIREPDPDVNDRRPVRRRAGQAARRAGPAQGTARRAGGTSSSPGSCTPASARLSPLGNGERG